MNKKIKRLATTTIICVLVASIFGSVMVLAPPDFIFPQLIDVFVTNTSDDPVPVAVTDDTLDVTLDEPIEAVIIQEFEPFQHYAEAITIPEDAIGAGSTPWEGEVGMIPEGKMLVIESVSAFAHGFEGDDNVELTIMVSERPDGEIIQVAYLELGTFGPIGNSRQTLYKLVKFYVGPEQEIGFQAYRSGSGYETKIFATVTGYIMDVS